MKRQSGQHEDGSILMMGLITITILTLICATSLYVTSQDANATRRPPVEQQAMAGAEAAVDQAMNGLNTGTWTGWSSQPPARETRCQPLSRLPAARQQSERPILPTTTIIRPAFRSRARQGNSVLNVGHSG